MANGRGRVTIPTDTNIVRETIEIMKRWGADALRDCDGTNFPPELADSGARVYATYYTTRKDNAWANANPDEIQQMYIMTSFHTALENAGGAGAVCGERLEIPLLKGLSKDMFRINDRDDIGRWWEVIDRTTGETVPASLWSFDAATGCVAIDGTKPYHEYTVSFLAYIIWDPVHMYNAVVNDWKDFERQVTFDVRQPKSREYSKTRLRRFLEENPRVDVVRFTTFFHQFTLMFDELAREKYVDWYGYSASVSPYILEQFEKEAGYAFRPEYIIDQGYYNNQYRVPSKPFRDFQKFQRKEVAALCKELVDIVHEYKREAMMFLGDHWIGTEPFMEEFAGIGLDAVVGSVGNGSTLRLISDIPGVKYTEGRFLPYFFPDTFHEGGDPVLEAKKNWVTARRALLRKPVDRIGYGGYLGLALGFPEFVDYVESVCDEFRTLYDSIRGTSPWCAKTVAVVNCWGAMRAWGCHMVHHALYQKENYSYAGVIEALSGGPYDVRFISFDDILADSLALEGVDVLVMVGDADTAHTGGVLWENPETAARIRRFIHEGGGCIGIGEPSGHQANGHFLQLASAFGVEKETGFTLNYDKYNKQAHEHFIVAEVEDAIDFGEGKKGIYALEGSTVVALKDGDVQLAVNDFGKGRCVYASGLPYSFENARVLHRAIMWSSGDEANLKKWYSENCRVDVHAFEESGKYCVVNNTYEPQSTVVYQGDGTSFPLDLSVNEIRWFSV